MLKNKNEESLISSCEKKEQEGLTSPHHMAKNLKPANGQRGGTVEAVTAFGKKDSELTGGGKKQGKSREKRRTQEITWGPKKEEEEVTDG